MCRLQKKRPHLWEEGHIFVQTENILLFEKVKLEIKIYCKGS